MTDHVAKQAAYAAKRAAITGRAPTTVTRPVRVIGLSAMDAPPRITYRADMEAEVRARMAAAGFEFADEVAGRGNFY